MTLCPSLLDEGRVDFPSEDAETNIRDARPVLYIKLIMPRSEVISTDWTGLCFLNPLILVFVRRLTLDNCDNTSNRQLGPPININTVGAVSR